ncbi:MAG TPA: short-chain dehydrogenase/reductase, partial [Solirubrobacteraceae bacterium]
MTWDLRGRTVLITGAARGIGAESARQLRAKGARLALAGLEPELLERRAAELGGDTAWFELDVTDHDALEAAVAGTVERFGGIDVVIANAGVAPNGPVATIDPAVFERTIEVNLLGVWRTVRVALPHVVARRGYVLPIASVAAAVHPPLMAAYTASKAGVEAFADSLRGELAHTGTAVGCAYFGFIDTDMVRRSFERRSAQMSQERGAVRLGKWASVESAGAAVVRGVEHRARKVYAPRWVL